MLTKNDLIKNLREYNSDEIVEAIKAGVVTLYELSKSGNLTPLMRKRIEDKLANGNAQKVETNPINAVTSEISDIGNSLPSQNNFQKEKQERDSIDVKQYGGVETVVQDKGPQSDSITSSEISYDNDDETKEIISNKGMFKRPFSFKGRIRRLEYGISFIIYFIWYFFINTATNSNSESGIIFLLLIIGIPALWFFWAQSCKRCHDRGNSGWYQIIPFYYLVLLFGKGETGENEYGDNPKE